MQLRTTVPSADEVVVAIHQPNFFPWLGYFDKIRRADIFIFLDDAQFPKKGGTWCNRVPVARDGQREWLTAPINRNYSGVLDIREVRFLDTDWRSAIIARLKLCYGHAPFSRDALKIVEPLVTNPENAIADFNVMAVRTLAARLGLERKIFVRSSDLQARSTGTDRLIELTRAVGGTVYLSGDGAQGYQDEEAFRLAGIELAFMNFAQPKYRQPWSDFVPGLSIIDALANAGPTAVADWLSKGGPTL